MPNKSSKEASVGRGALVGATSVVVEVGLGDLVGELGNLRLLRDGKQLCEIINNICVIAAKFRRR